jgi:hypothetical protein
MLNKTTITISDRNLRWLKERGKTFSESIGDLIDSALAAEDHRQDKKREKLLRIKELQPDLF